MGPSKLMAAMGNRGRLRERDRPPRAVGARHRRDRHHRVRPGIRSALAQVAADVLSLRRSRRRRARRHRAHAVFVPAAPPTAAGRSPAAPRCSRPRALRQKLVRVRRTGSRPTRRISRSSMVSVACAARPDAPSLRDARQERSADRTCLTGWTPSSRRGSSQPRTDVLYGVHVAAVEVAREHGTVRVLGYWIAHDAARC
jgi:CO/xanthine dehydrogenase Mo-binding subunit